MTPIPLKQEAEAATEDRKITFRVTREFRKRLKIFAAGRETSVEDLCKDAVTKFMESSDGGKARARA